MKTVDEVGVDKMGVDKWEVDEVGINHTIIKDLYGNSNWNQNHMD